MTPTTLNSICALFLFINFVASSRGLEPDSFFTICHRHDPNLNDCIKNTLEKMRPLLKTGIKELKLPSVEPMVVPKVKVLQGTGPVSIDSTFYRLHVEGITRYHVTQVEANLKDNKITIKVDIPYLYVHGDYDIKGQILILPIVGNGDSWSNYTGVSGVMNLRLKPIEKSGKTYLNLESLKFNIAVKHARIQMNNLFNGNKELGETMNRFMSQNWEVVFHELKPVVDEAISVLLTDTAKKVFNKFSFDQLFPK